MHEPAESLTPPETLSRNVKLLGAASLLNDIASEIMFPLMQDFLLNVLGGSKLQYGAIEGVADSTASLLKLWVGAWSDRLGRRRELVILGYVLSAMVRPLMGLAGAPWQAFVVRTTDRIGKGVRTAPRDALIADSATSRQRGRAFGFHRAMDHLGAAIGPLLAFGFLMVWPGQLRLLFLLTLIPGLIVVALLFWGLREAKPRVGAVDSAGENPAVGSSRGLTIVHLDRRFVLYLLALVLFTLGNSSDGFLLVRAQELGVPVTYLPVLWCGFHLLKSRGCVWGGRLVDRFGPKRPILMGWFIYAIVYLLFAWAYAAWQVWLLFGGYAVFYALTEPAEKTLVANLVRGHNNGAAFGWFNFAIGISALPSSLIFGAWYQNFGALAAFGWGAGLAAVAAILLACLVPDARPR